MAIQHHHTVLCDYVIQAKDGKPSLIGVFTNILLPGVPGGLLRMWVHLGISGEAGDRYSIAVEDETGAQIADLGEGTITEELLSGGQRVDQQEVARVGHINVAIAAAGIAFQRYGHYFVVLREGSRIVHRHDFGVVPPTTGDEGNG